MRSVIVASRAPAQRARLIAGRPAAGRGDDGCRRHAGGRRRPRSRARSCRSRSRLPQVVDEALAANLGLRAADLSLQQRTRRSSGTRPLLPGIDFAARYTRADGGRAVEVPVAALVNPVYTTLNELLAASRATARQFPRERDGQSHCCAARPGDEFQRPQPLYAPRLGPPSCPPRAFSGRGRPRRAAVAVVRDVTGVLPLAAAPQTVVMVDSTLDAARANLARTKRCSATDKVTQDQVCARGRTCSSRAGASRGAQPRQSQPAT